MAMLGDIKIMMLKGEKGDKGDGSYDDSELRELIAQETADREEEIAEMERNFLNYLYPVGSIYMSVGTTSPAVLFGGTWEQIEGKFLLASSSNHEVNSTGGSETHTPQGSVNNHTLTLAETPAHKHSTQMRVESQNLVVGSGSQGGVPYDFYIKDGNNYTATGDAYNDSADVAVGDPHNHGFTGTSGNYMPPYLTVNVWKRTA